MTGSVFTRFWGNMGPYFKAYREVGPGLVIMTYCYYKLSYGGNKAVKDKPAH